ncbi:MAG: 3-hydroxyacyl-CoA dehydrogenase NAD-binding domain-containing protein [Acetobacter aceti]|uniref:3-hydroxyacyl-CoA dehydrogenase n=1 Tax=Acetobacter aceti TaxID=435 RepID=A0A1U9KDG9_ACEAC|nr:3-hydroxyacyl-CoA dehydrogenase NAD-binding domain-containing protein [Acetobacter aceti]AQS83779.1 3-hydroxyacyl-CoA dehydrogenase [Acetobacter aceti]
MNTIRKIGIIGCGVIGASWAAYYLARGFDVSATDPAPDAERQLRELIARDWRLLSRIGLSPGASMDRLSFNADPVAALADVDFIQENGPERVDIKRALLAEITPAIREDVIIASSTSGIRISDIQGAAIHPERVVLGHPFNPPHLIPLVEVVGGKETSPEVIERTLRFYRDIGKKAIHVRREVKGHVANRLQAALFREAFSLVHEGVASVADVDAAISHGPGLRWALLGPFMNLNLSGGSGGIAHVIDHLGPPIETWWADLGTLSSFTPEIKAEAVEGIRDELGGHAVADVENQRDDVLIQLLTLKDKAADLP